MGPASCWFFLDFFLGTICSLENESWLPALAITTGGPVWANPQGYYGFSPGFQSLCKNNNS